jgi:calcineurin-like phosphoesterase family protein
MGNIFLTSDWHLGETRFNYLQRNVSTDEEHIELLMNNHNSVVGKTDLVYILGDVLYNRADVDKYLPLLNEFNGRKVLVRGNHDRHISDNQFRPYFQDVIAEDSGINIDFCSISCFMTHYPTRGKVDRFNLVGHVHGAWRVQLNSLNVGVDVHNMKPISVDDIGFHMVAISKHYDRDIWAGYIDCNMSYLGKRGLSSTYMDM